MTVYSRIFCSIILIFSSVGVFASVQSDGYKHYIFFVHGYVGNDADMPKQGEVNQHNRVWFDSAVKNKMWPFNWIPTSGLGDYLDSSNFLARYTNTGNEDDMTFSYLDRFVEVNMGLTDAHYTQVNPWGIETFSANLFQKITNVLLAEGDYSTPKKVDIIGHSMGGVIATHMVLNYRDTLYWYGAEFNTIVTLGSPHLGVPAGTLCGDSADPGCSKDLWNEHTSEWEEHDNLVALQLVAGSDFMGNRLHGNATSFNYHGINWFFGAINNDELIPFDSARAVGVDVLAGVTFTREELNVNIPGLNHAAVAGLKFTGCDTAECQVIDAYREKIRKFLDDAF